MTLNKLRVYLDKSFILTFEYDKLFRISTVIVVNVYFKTTNTSVNEPTFSWVTVTSFTISESMSVYTRCRCQQMNLQSVSHIVPLLSGYKT